MLRLLLAAGLLCLSVALVAQPGSRLAPDAERWVEKTFGSMSVEDKVGQLLVSSFQSTFISSDSEAYDAVAAAIRDQHVGGLHVFGGSQPAPGVLLNTGYGTVTLGQPLEAASMLNRMQQRSRLPLLNTADFETGVGFRIAGATTFPRAMAFGAAGDEQLAYEAGRMTGVEARALGVHVNFAPVVDVNNNPRNPVINTRSFGEDPAAVGRLAAAYVRGLQSAGVIATLKHFPGHGDTDTDSHLGLPIVREPRERLEQVEWPPYTAAIATAAGGVMTGHIEMPSLDPAPDTPATLSRPIVTGVLRRDLGFDGLVYTDSMKMAGVTAMYSPGEAAVRAIAAGNDVVLDSPDQAAAFAAILDAVRSGRLSEATVDESVRRLLRAKAAAGLYETRTVDLDKVAELVGTRASQGVADQVAARSITLLKDTSHAVPLRLAPGAQVLYLSVLDYPGGWSIAAPSRTFIPELRKRYPNVTAVELSDRSSADEIDLVRATASRYDAIVASVFVRAASGSGRQDLAPPLQRLLDDLARQTMATRTPYVTTLFGNPYVAMALPGAPALLLTYDFYDRAEAAAVRAIVGEAPIGGRLPVTMPGAFERGAGLDRPALSGPGAR